MAYLYAYSLRDRTHAAHAMVDDVPPDVKARRLQDLINTWRAEVGGSSPSQTHKTCPDSRTLNRI